LSNRLVHPSAFLYLESEILANYIGRYVDQFPSDDRLGKAPYFNAFRDARLKGHDAITITALGPAGYGARMHTLMTAIKELGERVEEYMNEMGANPQSGVNMVGDQIVERITGLRAVQNQIRADIPNYEARLTSLRDELAVLEKAG
jgi:hypothetical protein